MAPHSSTLAWKIPWTEDPGRLQSMGSLRVEHDWMTSFSLFTFMHWRRKWQPTPVFLPRGRTRTLDGGAWWAAVYGVTQSRTQLKWLSSSSNISILHYQIRSDQLLSRVHLFATPWIAACQASLSITTPGVHSDSRPSSQWCHPASDAIQPSHPLSSPSPLAPSPSQHQSLFQWVNS